MLRPRGRRPGVVPRRCRAGQVGEHFTLTDLQQGLVEAVGSVGRMAQARSLDCGIGFPPGQQSSHTAQVLQQRAARVRNPVGSPSTQECFAT